jgi:hypothetical protein
MEWEGEGEVEEEEEEVEVEVEAVTSCWDTNTCKCFFVNIVEGYW